MNLGPLEEQRVFLTTLQLSLQPVFLHFNICFMNAHSGAEKQNEYVVILREIRDGSVSVCLLYSTSIILIVYDEVKFVSSCT